MTIAIIKYGMGNVASVQKALNKIGYNSIITNNHIKIKQADLILLPGVGSFKKGMDNLHESGLVDLLTQEVVVKKKPFIGICLGMQLIASKGTEPEDTNGLGWIDGEVVKIESTKGLRIPHLGWNTLISSTNDEFYSEFNGQDCYFIHSYHFKVVNKDEVVFKVPYERNLVAAVEKNNIHAMQFHPEKSQVVGMQLLKNIIDKYA